MTAFPFLRAQSDAEQTARGCLCNLMIGSELMPTSRKMSECGYHSAIATGAVGTLDKLIARFYSTPS